LRHDTFHLRARISPPAFLVYARLQMSILRSNAHSTILSFLPMSFIVYRYSCQFSCQTGTDRRSLNGLIERPHYELADKKEACPLGERRFGGQASSLYLCHDAHAYFFRRFAFLDAFAILALAFLFVESFLLDLWISPLVLLAID
jgi:hypothetical protein